MQMPDNMGNTYTEAFRKIFPSVAKIKHIHHVDFLLEGVAADKSLNLADGIHPNEEGQKVVAKHVYKKINEIKLIKQGLRSNKQPYCLQSNKTNYLDDIICHFLHFYTCQYYIFIIQHAPPRRGN